MSACIRAMMTIESDDTEELTRILDHHVDYLIDVDDNRDIVKSISGVMSYDPSSEYDTAKICMLSQIVDDILGSGVPTDEELDFDNDKIAFYSTMQTLRNNLYSLGIDK